MPRRNAKCPKRTKEPDLVIHPFLMTDKEIAEARSREARQKQILDSMYDAIGAILPNLPDLLQSAIARESRPSNSDYLREQVVRALRRRANRVSADERSAGVSERPGTNVDYCGEMRLLADLLDTASA